MNDNEIDAILMPEFARHFLCEPGNLTATEAERIAYRAGMREAMRITRENAKAQTDWGYATHAHAIADAIERAASDEQKGGAE